MGMAEKERRPPPYVSYKTWNTFLQKVKGQLPLPNHIDSSFWAYLPFSGSNQSALRGTLVYLGLLDGGHPDLRLEQLANAENEERQNLLREIFTQSYEELLDQVDLTRTTRGRLREYFKSVGAEGQLGQKCTAFFLCLAREAGETLHASLQAKSVSARGRKVRRKRKAEISPGEQGEVRPPLSKTNNLEILTHLDPSMTGLLQRLPLSSSQWSQHEKQGWKKAFDALFEFLYREKKD